MKKKNHYHQLEIFLDHESRQVLQSPNKSAQPLSDQDIENLRFASWVQGQIQPNKNTKD